MSNLLKRAMSISMRRGVAAAAVCLCVAIAADAIRAQQPRVVVSSPQPQGLTRTGSAAVTGTVLDAASGRAVAGAIVVLEERRPGERARSLLQVSSPTGRFAFVDLPASEWYQLTASKPGYLAGGYGRSDPRGPAAPLALAGDQWLRDLRVTMARPGSISGTVVDERGEPIVGAHVRVLPQVPVAGRTQWLAGPVARTDDRGFYRIAGLGPGQYVVSVPYVQATLPAGAKPQRPGASAGTSMADLLAAREALDAGLLLLDAGSGQQLVVGRYATPPPAPDGGRMVYPTTFHPNVPVPADARAIDLGLSEDRTAIDFQLQPVRAVNVTGIVQGPPEAIANQHLRLLRAGLEELGQGSETATTLTDAEGRFTFVAVPAGSYVIDARHTMLDLSYTSMESMATALPAPVPFAARSAASLGVAAAPPGVSIVSLDDRSAVPYWAHAAIEVGDRDLDGIVVLLQRPVTLSGRIVLPSGSPAPRGGVGLTLEPADGRRTLGMLSSRPIDAQRFAFDNLMAGEYVLRSSFSTYSIDSVTWNGADYTDRPFDAAAGKDITEVTVRLAAVTSSVSGQVRDGTSDLTSGAAVIAFPIERERWSRYGFNPPRIKSALTTADGRFRIDRLPVGDYHVVAVPAARERAWLDPEFLALHAARASRIRIDRHDAALAGVALTLVR